MRNLRVKLKSRSARPARRGATSTEYILILIGVVIPIAALLPMAIKMISNYGSRMTHGLQLPFP